MYSVSYKNVQGFNRQQKDTNENMVTLYGPTNTDS